MKSKPDYDHLARLISKNNLQEVIDIILDPKLDVDNEFSKEVQLISNRFTRLEKQTRLGIISKSDEQLEKNQIAKVLIDLISKNKSSKKVRKKKSQKKVLLFLIYFTLLAIGFWFFSQPKENIHSKLTSFQLSQLAFDTYRETSLFGGETFQSLNFQNFTSISINADSVLLQVENQKDTILPISKNLIIQPIQGINYVGIQFDTVKVESLHLMNSAKVNISHLSNEMPSFRLQVQQKNTLQGWLNYEGKLKLQTTNYKCKYPNWRRFSRVF